MAALAPMPSASVMTAIRVNPGFLTSVRNPCRRSCQRLCNFSSQVVFDIASTHPLPQVVLTSFVPQRHQRIDFRRAARGDIAREQRNGCEHHSNSPKRYGIGWADSEEQTANQTR